MQIVRIEQHASRSFESGTSGNRSGYARSFDSIYSPYTIFACNVSSLIISVSSFPTQTTGVGRFISPVTIYDLTKELRRFDIYKNIYQSDIATLCYRIYI